MKRKITRVLAAVFAMVMLMSCMSFSAFATSSEASAADTTTTTTKRTTAPNGHTYELYQVFTGQVAAGTDTLSNPVYGVNAKLGEDQSLGDKVADSIIAYISGLKTTATNPATNKNYTEAEIAAILSSYVDLNSTPFSKTINMPKQQDSDVVDGTYNIQPYQNPSENSSVNNLLYKNLPAGYYMVKDNNNSTGAYTLYIFQVTGGTISMEPKGNSPVVTKKITSASGSIDVANGSTTNAVSMGDTIHFAMYGTVSSYTDSFYSYYYKFTDTLSGGFDLEADSVHVYINDTDHEVTNWFYVNAKENTSDGVKTSTTLTVAIEDLLRLQNLGSNNFSNGAAAITINANTKIYVCYDATLNDNANVSYNLTYDAAGDPSCDDANTNSVDVTYTRDPNTSDTGDPGRNTDVPSTNPSDEPTPPADTPTTDSSPDVTYTFTTGIKIQKSNSANLPLSGAKFTLTAKNNKDQSIVSTNNDATFDVIDGAVTEGTTVYYKVNVSSDITSYTNVDPNSSDVSDSEKALYEKNTAGNYVKYKKTDATTTTTELNSENKYSYEATVDASGYLTFTGLGPGTYVLSETNAPTGYSQMADVEIEIAYSSSGYEQTATNSKVYFKITGTGKASYSVDDGYFHWNIVDETAASLPSTGGIGTTIFYVVGSCLAVGAAVLLITKKRMHNEVG